VIDFSGRFGKDRIQTSLKGRLNQLRGSSRFSIGIPSALCLGRTDDSVALGIWIWAFGKGLSDEYNGLLSVQWVSRSRYIASRHYCDLVYRDRCVRL
jgi:hypothetical protein